MLNSLLVITLRFDELVNSKHVQGDGVINLGMTLSARKDYIVCQISLFLWVLSQPARGSGRLLLPHDVRQLAKRDRFVRQVPIQ